MPFVRREPLLDSSQFFHLKDPCPVFDGDRWHLYGSGARTDRGELLVLHATAPALEGPWQEEPPAQLTGVRGGALAAPGVIYAPEESFPFQMFIQTDYRALGSRLEHLTSADGQHFHFTGTALASIAESHEAAIYDPHPAEIGGRKYLTYSGSLEIGRPDIFLAESQTGRWSGPWRRLAQILRHAEIPHHNQLDHEDYEWGLEGSQLVALPSGRIFLNAVCFLPQARPGERQRIFFAAGEKVTGPFRTLGPIFDRLSGDWEPGENGHASALIRGDELYLFYQARSLALGRWRWGLATVAVSELEIVVSDILGKS